MKDNGSHRLCSPPFRHDQGNRQITGERGPLASAIRFRVWTLYSDPRSSQGSQPNGWTRGGEISQRSLNEGLDLHEGRIARDVRGHPRPKPNPTTRSERGSGFPGQEGDWDGDGREKNLRTRFMRTSDSLSPSAESVVGLILQCLTPFLYTQTSCIYDHPGVNATLKPVSLSTQLDRHLHKV